jgi:hypothetical protein
MEDQTYRSRPLAYNFHLDSDTDTLIASYNHSMPARGAEHDPFPTPSLPQSTTCVLADKYFRLGSYYGTPRSGPHEHIVEVLHG